MDFKLNSNTSTHVSSWQLMNRNNVGALYCGDQQLHGQSKKLQKKQSYQSEEPCEGLTTVAPCSSLHLELTCHYILPLEHCHYNIGSHHAWTRTCYTYRTQEAVSTVGNEIELNTKLNQRTKCTLASSQIRRPANPERLVTTCANYFRGSSAPKELGPSRPGCFYAIPAVREAREGELLQPLDEKCFPKRSTPFYTALIIQSFKPLTTTNTFSESGCAEQHEDTTSGRIHGITFRLLLYLNEQDSEIPAAIHNCLDLGCSS